MDEQQVNLTRFSVLFPEKRDFFLESRGLFDFGKAGGGGVNSDPIVPILFFSRRIGLESGGAVPIDFGTRLSGKQGRYGIGAFYLKTGDEPTLEARETQFAVLRVKRDILRRSTIGGMFTNRSDSTAAPGRSNQAFGLDTLLSFYDNVNVSGSYARTRTPGLDGDAASYAARAIYGGDRYGLQIDHLFVGEDFNPEVGYLRRHDFRRTFASTRFSPRPRSIRSVRKFTFEGNTEYILNGSGDVDTRAQLVRFVTELQSSDQLTVEASHQYELLVAPFPIARSVTIPVGGYTHHEVNASYLIGGQRRVNGTLSARRGTFYDGDIAGFGFGTGRVAVTPRLSLEPSFAVNRVRLPYGAFSSNVYRTRADYAFTSRMFASGFLQYNSADRAVSSNLRFRWEYRPGSELFVVYTDERDTSPAASVRGVKNRALVVKINRLFRF